MRLTIKAIIRWEQLNQKPFSRLDYNNEDEIISLFYACSLGVGRERSLAEFTKSLKPRDIKNMVADFEKQTSIVGQFQSTPETNGPRAGEPPAPAFIKDIAATLIMGGLDADFVLNDMELCDLSVFTHAYEQKIKETLTTQRLWVFMMLSPNLKKGAKPQDIYPFEWELAEKLSAKILSEEEVEEGINEFQTFLQTDLTK